jgi:hypothetical protein
MQITIQSVSVEVVKPGPKGYSQATVAYSYNGQPRTQKIVSFANPAVFKQVASWEQALPDGPVEVTMVKNAQGYNEWAGIGAGSGPSQGPAAATPNKVVGSSYPTNEERAKTQVYIVKQSSLSNAIAYHNKQESGVSPEEIIATAQIFVDFVMDSGDAA